MSLKYKKNDIIYFNGNMHYTQSNNGQGKPCAPGIARISNTAYEYDTHPYHVIADPAGNASVWGWVQANTIEDITVNDALDRLTYLGIINSPEYWKQLISQVNYLDNLILNANKLISSKKNNSLDLSTAIDTLITAHVINSPEYWKAKAYTYNNVALLICKLAESIDNSLIDNSFNSSTLNQSNSSILNRSEFISTAQSYLGYNEWDGSHRIIIDIYNNYGNLPSGYKVTYFDSWCATFVSAMAILVGIADTIIPRECSCERQINLFKKLNAWQEDDNYMPSLGDIVYYTWDGDEWSSNENFADHVGIITSIQDENDILVIEGNKNDQVAYRTIWRNHPYIRGYATPHY